MEFRITNIGLHLLCVLFTLVLCQERAELNCLYNRHKLLQMISLQSSFVNDQSSSVKIYAVENDRICPLDVLTIIKTQPTVYKLWINSDSQYVPNFKCGFQMKHELLMKVIVSDENKKFMYIVSCPLYRDRQVATSIPAQSVSHTTFKSTKSIVTQLKTKVSLSIVDEKGREIEGTIHPGQLVRLRSIMLPQRSDITGHMGEPAGFRKVACEARPSQEETSIAIQLVDSDGCVPQGGILHGEFIGDGYTALSGTFKMFSFPKRPQVYFQCNVIFSYGEKSKEQAKSHCLHTSRRVRRQTDEKTETTTVGTSVRIKDSATEEEIAKIKAQNAKSTQTCMQNQTLQAVIIVLAALLFLSILVAIFFCICTLRIYRMGIIERQDHSVSTEVIHIDNRNGFPNSKPPSYHKGSSNSRY